MTPEQVMNFARQAMLVTLMLGAPLLLVALLAGLVISIFQAATQINEATLSFIPKLLIIFATLAFAGPWMLDVIVNFTRETLLNIPAMVN
jgi:flagellar biosynthesis protein FliQ